MINTLFGLLTTVAVGLLIFYWYANYSTKSGFATDQNKNNIPDSWEKYELIFRFKNIIILLLGIVLGYLFNYISIL